MLAPKYLHAQRRMGASGVAHLVARLFDSRNNFRIGGTSAKVAAHVFLDLYVASRVAFSNTSNRGHDLTGRAITTLKPVLINEGLLYWM
jgi:hypothetical protein